MVVMTQAVWRNLCIILFTLQVNLIYSNGAVNVSTGTVRLYRNGVPDTGQSWSSGIVQIYYNYEWGNICDDGSFASDEADVICHQLGYTGASSYSNTGNTTTFGDDNSVTSLIGVQCSTMKYLTITQCSFSTNISSSCGNANDVIVTCYSTRIWDSPTTGDIRLTRGTYSNQGLLEVYCNGEWGTVCDDTFNDTHARIACRQLGYNDYYRYSHLSLNHISSQRNVWLEYFYSECTSIYCLTNCAYNGCNNAAGSSFCLSPSNDVTLECGYDPGNPNVYSFTSDSCDTDSVDSPPSFNYAHAWIPSTPIIVILLIIVPIVMIVNRYFKNKRKRQRMRNQAAIELQQQETRFHQQLQTVAQLNTNTLQNIITSHSRNEFAISVLAPPRGEPPSYADTVEIFKPSSSVQQELSIDAFSCNQGNTQPPSFTGPPPPFEPNNNNNKPLLVPAPPTYRDAV